MNKIEQLIKNSLNELVKKSVQMPDGQLFVSLYNAREILEKHLQDTTEDKCFYCEENKCNCEQQELIERHIADDTTEYKSPDFLEDDNGKKYKKIKENCYEEI